MIHHLPVDRRTVFRAGALGAAALATPALAQASGFTHGVASGEPGPKSVLLWTRFVAAGEARLKWEVAEDAGFAKIVRQGECLASPARDWCAKAPVTGLTAGRWYWYRFVAVTGAKSAVGRTRTLPSGKVDRFRIAVFSCSNTGFGWFNAYAHAAASDEFELAVHLGDYIYEQRKGIYPSDSTAVPGRPQMAEEANVLARYRERYASYRADSDLQSLHAALPMIVIRDDHESANDAWKDGAEGHQPETEGAWAARKAVAEQVWREWLPVSEADYAAYEVGNLATLFRLESRHLARDKQLDFGPAAQAGEAALRAFRDGPWRDPKRTMLGAAQESWLAQGFKRSVRQGKRWQVLLQQVIMAQRTLPPMVLEKMPAAAPGWIRERITASVDAGKIGLPFSMDMWDGYPAARERLLRSAATAKANLVVLAGDSHNCWGSELGLGGAPVGVEFAGTSVTSPGAEGTLPWVLATELAPAMVAASEELKWCDTAKRGYLALELTPAEVSGEWRFLKTIRQRDATLSGTHRMAAAHGARRFTRS